MRKQLVIPAIGMLVAGLSSAFWMVSAADPTATVRMSVDVDVALAKDSDFLSGFVPSRTTIAHLFQNHMIHSADTQVLVSSIASAIDVRKLRAGQPYAIDRLLDGRVRRFEYEIDANKRLTVERASIEGAPRFIATVERIPKQTTVVTVEGDINRETNSLFAAIDKAGEHIDLALGMADVFSGEIDFNSDLQPGDRFRVLVERHTREGKLSGYGAILAAEFVNDGRRLRAVRFTPEGGAPAYYDENGRSLKRFFLKSPLKFEPRITSRFSTSRRHPILGYARAHNGVDYFAPLGAPVGFSGARCGDARRLDQRRRTHREGSASKRLRDGIPAPLVDLRPRRRAHRPGRARRPRRQDGPRDRRPSALRHEEERPLREPGRRASQHAAGRAGARRTASTSSTPSAIATSRCSSVPPRHGPRITTSHGITNL